MTKLWPTECEQQWCVQIQDDALKEKKLPSFPLYHSPSAGTKAWWKELEPPPWPWGRSCVLRMAEQQDRRNLGPSYGGFLDCQIRLKSETEISFYSVWVTEIVILLQRSRQLCFPGNCPCLKFESHLRNSFSIFWIFCTYWMALLDPSHKVLTELPN